MRRSAGWLALSSLLGIAALAGHEPAWAQYRWVDERGVVHYSQFPPPGSAAPPPAPEAKPTAAPGAKPSAIPRAKPSAAPEAKPSPPPPLSPGHERSIRELVRLASGTGVTDVLFQQLAQAMLPTLRPGLERQLQRSLSQAEEGKLAEAVRRTYTSVFPTALFENEMVRVYARHFSEAEANELLRFYRSPIGGKVMRLSAVLAGEGAAIGQRLAKTRQAELSQRLRDELAREFSR